ncbi:unnamed protein product [Cylindrotheca closterium]|uniref:Uncharacterized protein n=1 Tax=Cylindrotheca closterium TaxID=2856 RepID=A0AAD2JK85_9STRA|nr:unnamed protein product [Cylindrotheca closterium]
MHHPPLSESLNVVPSMNVEIEIPSSVTSIGMWAFEDCQSLAKVHFHHHNHHEDGAGADAGSSSSSLATMGDMAFAGCKSLTHISIPSSVEIIRTAAFCLCMNIHEIGNLRVIGQNAFDGCVKLKTISIPSTIERLARKTFQNCESLLEIKFQNGLKYVEDSAFHSCKNLQSVALPKSVEVIGTLAFGQCSKLVSVEWVGACSRGTEIQDDAFAECKSLINICLSDDVHSGGVSAGSFRGCTALENQYGDTNTISLALTHRFEDFPVHNKCYHASVTTADELAREIESLMQSSSQGNDICDRLVDPFGMTPFHILLSAANCKIDLLQVLLDAYPAHVLGWKDVNEKNAVEYFCQRSYHLSEDSQLILQATLQRWLVDSISSWNAGLEAWTLDMANRMNAIVAESELTERQSLLQEASIVLSRYERMEATTLLELS